MNLPLPTGPDPLRKLSEELHALAEEFRERKVTLQEVMGTLGGRASGLMIVILALPFCSPISIPGLSVPFGAVIFVLGACFVGGRPPWLPRRLLAVQLPPKFFRAVLEGASKFIGWIERRLHPRWTWVTGSTAIMRVHGLLVCAGAAVLLLPLGGIPFTNMFPALVVVVGTLGMMERDGVAVAAAYGIFGATLVYFATFAGVVIELFAKLTQWIAG
jgi:hypothetical protein